MNKAEIDKYFKTGFSLFEGYKALELIPEPKENKDNLLWLWCYDANMMPCDFPRFDHDLKNKVVIELINDNRLKSVPITIVIDGLIVAECGRVTKFREYEEKK